MVNIGSIDSYFGSIIGMKNKFVTDVMSVPVVVNRFIMSNVPLWGHLSLSVLDEL
jgi:hypothetical protein